MVIMMKNHEEGIGSAAGEENVLEIENSKSES